MGGMDANLNPGGMDTSGTPSNPVASPPLIPTTAESNIRTWCVACHLASLSGFITGFGFILGPLIVWLLKKHASNDIDVHGRESLDFQISMFLYGAVLAGLGFLTCGVTWGLLVVLAVFQIVATILAAVRTSNGVPWRYPLTIRFLGRG